MTERFKAAIAAFDEYNSNDPNREDFQGKDFPKELIYAQRVSERLNAFAPHAPEHVQLAARCQHIGRWEIPRSQYAMDRKGYLLWRSLLKQLHATIAGQMLNSCGYDTDIIEKVKFLLLKKELQSNPDTKLLEDVVCLVFIEYYLDDFAAKHDKEKVIEILQKTMKKMTPRAIAAVALLPLSAKVKTLIHEASARQDQQ